MMHVGRQPAAPPPPRLHGYADGKVKPYSPSAVYQAKRVLLGLVVGTLAGGLLGSIGSAALWTIQAGRSGMPSFFSR